MVAPGWRALWLGVVAVAACGRSGLGVTGLGGDAALAGGDSLFVDQIGALSLTTGSGTTTVGNGAFAVTFDEARGGVPTGMTVSGGSGVNLVGQDTSKDEVWAAISFFDVWFSWRPDAAVPVAVRIEGPAVTQVELVWAAGGAPAVGGSGTSRYTIYPDGRIHRFESVSVHEALDVCFLAYLTIPMDAWNRVEWDVGDGPNVTAKIDSGAGNEIYNGQASDRACACAASDAGDLVGWSHHESGAVVPDGLRIWESEWGNHLLLATEWAQFATVPVGDYVAEIMMLLRAGTTCDPVREAIAPFLEPPVAAVTAGALVTTSPTDRDQDGFDESTGAWMLSAASGDEVVFTLTGAPSPTLAVHVASWPGTVTPVIRLGGVLLTHGADFLFQSDTGGAWIFIDRPVASGVEVRILAP